MSSRYPLRLLTILLLLSACVPAAGAEALSRDRSAGSILKGVVLDADTETPLGWTQLQLVDLKRGVVAHADGSYHFFNLPIGTHTLRAIRIGYHDVLTDVTLKAGDTLAVNVLMSRSPVALSEIQITTAGDRQPLEAARVDVRIEGSDLQRTLSSTVAESMQLRPGVAMRAMGPAPSRPVIRGLGGDRLLVLEDGRSVGDLSATSSDHAVAIDPATAHRIDVIRGPAALAYGSSVLGGVVDVQRSTIACVEPHRLTGRILLQTETVNQSAQSALELKAPLGPIAISLDGGLRATENVNTPTGRLNNSSLSTLNGSLGATLIRRWGNVGLSGSRFNSEYGVPGGFVGAHPNGADIELGRRHFTARGVFFCSRPWLSNLEFGYDFSWYHHTEFESDGSVGVEFGVLTDNFLARANLDEHGPFRKGMIGVWAELRDYKNGGLSFTPDSDERAAALYLYEEATLGGWRLEGSWRGDVRNVLPDTPDPDAGIGAIGTRKFAGWSAAAAIEHSVHRRGLVGLSLMKSFRPPRIEELFSEGPHLAAFSYEIGNPDLDAEHGLGAECYTQVRTSRIGLRVALFWNELRRYIFPEETGRMSPRRNDLLEYRVTGQDARLVGSEFEVEWTPDRCIALSASSDFVHGELSRSRSPLPRIPPLRGHLGIAWSPDHVTLRLDGFGSARQARVGEFEQHTAASLRVDASLQWSTEWGGMHHVLTLAVNNLFDSEYRDHLNRVKAIMPEPGRNLKLGLLAEF